ncbi:hypothetical protein H8A97_25185 [Bradyrhizobium sp. Arg62]|uniref:hypothetical protein n=1 Tax=Bradyrhizobium TaxID=374 RepID=UPI001E2ED807|nr:MULTISPECIES: hypothetical protein [Bradyrhizobium]MCC8938368.1 hypothetical protein [Bradyrhizobium ivorense]MCC8948313.1 hypothetical protein [Bradyrhizobium brasilense]
MVEPGISRDRHLRSKLLLVDRPEAEADFTTTFGMIRQQRYERQADGKADPDAIALAMEFRSRGSCQMNSPPSRNMPIERFALSRRSCCGRRPFDGSSWSVQGSLDLVPEGRMVYVWCRIVGARRPFELQEDLQHRDFAFRGKRPHDRGIDDQIF